MQRVRLPKPRVLLDGDGIRRFYEASFHRLSGHGLWFLGGEPNVQAPEEMADARLRFLVCRLSTYRDTAGSITHGLLGQVAREVAGTFVDFAYLPPPRDLEIFLESGVPLWTGTTTKEPPRAFDVLGVSNSIAQELLNLPLALRASGIPLWKSERMADPSCPLVILGGNNSAAAAVIHGDAAGGDSGGLVDAAIVGECEEALPIFLRVLLECRERGRDKRETLRACHGRVPGFYEPDRYRYHYGTRDAERTERLLAIKAEPGVAMPVKRALVHDLDAVRINEDAPIPYDDESAGRAALPIDLGCPCFCNFCREGWEVKPYRERSPEAFLVALRRAKQMQGLHTADFMSYNFNMHARFYEILTGAMEVVDAVTMKSQRFDILAEDPLMAGVQHASGKSQFTCGMEGISERLRRFMHKNLTRNQILAACRGIFDARARELKIFLIATGREEAQDFAEWDALLADLVELRGSRPTRILASLTPLLPMPNTPSQFMASRPMAPEQNPIVSEVAAVCERRGVEFRTSIEGDETEIAQFLLLGDRRLTPILARAACDEGFLFVDGVPSGAAEFFRREAAAAAIDVDVMLGEKRDGDVLPWVEIDTGVPQTFLWEKYLEAVRFTETEYCLDRLETKGHCFQCDACPTPKHVVNLVRRRISPPPREDQVRALVDRRRHAVRLRLRVRVARQLGAAPMRFLQAAVARALLLAAPDLVPAYLRPGAVLDPFEGKAFLFGERVMDLVFLGGTSVTDVEAAARAAAPHLRWIEIADVREADSDAPTQDEITLRLRPLLPVEPARLRGATTGALRAARVKFTEKKSPRSRLFESDGRNRLGLHRLELDETAGTLTVTAATRDDLRPVLAALIPKAAAEIEVLPTATPVLTN
ncbi:MAG: hypothetical protein HYR85_02075 [Planctomycetes bacterium]|nr:hypothetical protein [Planctomycetota bacterium]